MRTLGNIIWFILGGLWISLGWLIIGVLLCITVIGIPAGVQCFKMAGLTLFPFKKQVVYGGKVGSFLLNILWILIFGWELALSYIVSGLIMMATIIGIPFGLQCFKMSKLALMPFGATIKDINS